MHFSRFFIIGLWSIFLWSNAIAQREQSIVKGIVVDEEDIPFAEAHVKLKGTSIGTITDPRGRFEIKVPANTSLRIEVTHVQTSNAYFEELAALAPDEVKKMKIELARIVKLVPFDFEATRGTKGNTMVVIEPNKIQAPNVSGDISTYLKTLAGVNSNNELSTQYSVRGGNYDENLVYINGIEIYRPFLNRSGQSEGLSIVNTNMIQSLAFSAGGFDAYYGDKLSSVLDITYKKPDSFAAVVEGGLLGGAAHVEGRSSNYRLSYMLSGRYRTNRYLLNSLDVQGAYNPVFSDYQSYISYRLGVKSSISWLSYYGSNRYLSVPESQTTKFGTVRDAIQIDVFYEGQELTQYQTFLNALLYEWMVSDELNLQLSSSVYTTDESERFDVLGQYVLSELDNEIGSETFGDPKNTLGVGSYLNHARNFLNAAIFNVQHRGSYQKGRHNVAWGGKFQHEIINDKLKEWSYLDSAGYSVPRGVDESLDFSEVILSDLNLETNRASAYVQDQIILQEAKNAKLNVGVRTNYWDYNGQWLVAPRVNFSVEPNRKHNERILKEDLDIDSLKKNIRLKASLGLFQQPPFYRELRSRTGELVEGVKAQQSLHAVAGADWNFELWQRTTPFKFSAEFYYKRMWDLIPYDVENVRIRYLPELTADGYVVGADFHVNGEFIPDLPSWFSFSLLSARENIEGDTYENEDGEIVEKGWIRRPTDQRYAFNILFQDFLKNNEDYHVHLNLVFAHGLPYGPPGYPEYRNALRVAPYRRVDIGFSRVMFDRQRSKNPSRALNLTENVTLSLEIFNLFGIRNTISYLWLKDIFNRQFAVPNYLTGRRFNLQLKVRL